MNIKSEPLKVVEGYSYGQESLGKLLTADEVAPKVYMRAERLLELASLGYVPYLRIDNGPPLFKARELVSFIRQNYIQKYDAKPLPVNFIIQTVEKPKLKLPVVLTQLDDQILEYHSVEPTCCVYFLVKNNDVVYVGQTIRFPYRMNGHIDEKEFDRVLYIPVEKSRLREVEEFWIKNLKPSLNSEWREGRKHPIKEAVNG